MGIKSISLAAIALVLSTSVNSAIISVDWQSAGDNLITQDTDSGLEWLDLTATSFRSYNDISSKLSTGQEFDGWRYATTTEISEFFDAFGGDSNYYNGWSTQNNGLFDIIAPYWGDLMCEEIGCVQPGDGASAFITSESDPVYGSAWQRSGYVEDNVYDALSATQDRVVLDLGPVSVNEAGNYRFGSALVRTSVVPVPAAVWLFGSGIIGLVGFARLKKA